MKGQVSDVTDMHTNLAQCMKDKARLVDGITFAIYQQGLDDIPLDQVDLMKVLLSRDDVVIPQCSIEYFVSTGIEKTRANRLVLGFVATSNRVPHHQPIPSFMSVLEPQWLIALLQQRADSFPPRRGQRTNYIRAEGPGAVPMEGPALGAP